MTALATPSFSVAVPGDWIIIDVEGTADVQVITEIIDRRVADGIIDPASRDAAVRLVTRISQSALDSGVRFAAAMVTEDDGGPVVISMAISFATLPPPGDVSDPDDDIEVTLRRNLAEQADQGESLDTRTLSRDAVVLAGGRQAIRVTRVVGYPITTAMTQELYAIQYVVPLEPEGVALVATATSPAIRRSEDIDELIDAIMQTLDVEST